jgi:hypothetical protein
VYILRTHDDAAIEPLPVLVHARKERQRGGANPVVLGYIFCRVMSFDKRTGWEAGGAPPREARCRRQGPDIGSHGKPSLCHARTDANLLTVMHARRRRLCTLAFLSNVARL